MTGLQLFSQTRSRAWINGTMAASSREQKASRR